MYDKISKTYVKNISEQFLISFASTQTTPQFEVKLFLNCFLKLINSIKNDC